MWKGKSFFTVLDSGNLPENKKNNKIFQMNLLMFGCEMMTVFCRDMADRLTGGMFWFSQCSQLLLFVFLEPVKVFGMV